MIATEHSTLVFLLNAIEAAPAKSKDLIVLASQRMQASDAFVAVLAELGGLVTDIPALVSRSAQLRRQLRQ